MSHDEIDRRDVLKSGAAMGLLAGTGLGRADGAQAQALTPTAAPGQPLSSTLVVNGRPTTVSADPRVTLLDALREHLGLSGTKKGCDQGQCGACTVLVNGRRINSCLTLVALHDGDEVTTIEGLGSPADLHPIQAAFIEHDGFQCGYCTPGQIMSVAGMIEEARQGGPSHVSADLIDPGRLTDAEIRERLSGNICRCAAYPNIVAAVRDAAGDLT